MAAQVEVQTGEVGRTGVGGRLHLSPLTDSSNKSLIEGPSSTSGSLIITPEPSKPVPGPKPRLTPKPFAVEKNPTIRPILAPKPQTKPWPEPTRPTSYKPDPPSAPKTQTANVTSKPRPVSTNPSRAAPTSFKPSPKLNTGQTIKPVVQPFKPAPPLPLGDPSKPTPPQPATRQKPGAASYSRGPKKPPAAEWSGTTKKEEEREKAVSGNGTGGASMTRAKSMGFLSQIGQEEEEKGEIGPEVVLRPQSKGSRPRPVSAIFLPSPTQTESPTPASRWAGRRPLSADLTAKFESIGLSLHRKTPKADSKENTPEDRALLQWREREKGSDGTMTTPQGADGMAKPTVADQKNEKKKDGNEEEKGGGSIKRRISLLLDSSSSPGAGVTSQGSEPHSPATPIPEAEPPLGIKQRIKKLTEDTPPAQTPFVKLTPKPRPLPLDLTKRFTSERSTDLGSPSFSEATDYHESGRDPLRRGEEFAANLGDQEKVEEEEDEKGSPEQLTQPSPDPMSGGPKEGQTTETISKESGPSSEVQTVVRASLFENVVERHSVLVLEEDQPKDKGKALLRCPSLKQGDEEEEEEESGSLVTATYRQPVSPPSPMCVVHSFDTVQTVEESKAVSESLPSAYLEDMAMTLRSRRSEGTRPGRSYPVVDRPTPAQGDPVLDTTPEQQPRYLRVGALPKWNDVEMERGRGRELERESQVGLEKEREQQREADREEAAAPKRLKMLEADEQPKPRATYFALTGQIQEPASPVEAGAERGDTAVPLDDFSVRSGQWGSQGKVVPLRRNPSLEEAFGRSPQSQIQGDVLMEKSQIRPAETEEMEVEKQREPKRESESQKDRMNDLEREKLRQLEIERQKHLEFARMKERERQREFERQRQKEFEKEKQRELEERWREAERLKQQEMEKERQRELERERQRELERERQRELEREKQRELEREKQRELESEKQQELEREKQQELEREKQRELEREKQELERERQRELERERQRKLERERQRELERENQRELERENQRELERERQRELERERQRELERERQREMERERQRAMEREKQRAMEREKQREMEREKQREMERERQRELEREKQELERERQQELEMERQRELERGRQRELERERQRELERERQRELERERQRELEREKQRELEIERQRELEIERQRELERERQREQERERQRELERERQRELERERQREQERQRELDKERRQLEIQRERQRSEELKQIKEMERRQLFEFERQKQVERERQQLMELEKQRLKEKMEREEAEKMRQMALQMEVERQRELERERERQREMEKERVKELERETQRELERQKQRNLERERQKQLDFERQELENQRLRQLELQKERKRAEELERIKEMERRQLMEFEKQKQLMEFEKQKQVERERQQLVELEKQKLREKMERDEVERMRLIAKQQEAERQRIKEKQRRAEQERVALDSSPLRPKVLDLDSVLRDEQFSKGSLHHGDPATRWKQPSPRAEEPYKPAILDIDSFTSQTQPSPPKEMLTVAGIQGVDTGSGARSHLLTPERDSGRRMAPEGSMGRPSPVWAPSHQDLWPGEMTVDRPMAGPDPPRKPANKPSLEQLLLRQEERVLAPSLVPEKRWSRVPDEPQQHTAPSLLRREANMAGSPGIVPSSTPMEQMWFPREAEHQGGRADPRNYRRSLGSQELNRMRSRSMSRRSTPPESAVEGSLSRMRSRSAHREGDSQSLVQQKQSGEEETKDTDTLVHETDSQYGTWETGLRTDDSLTPATPTSDGNLSPSPRKPSPPLTPGEHAPSVDLDTPDRHSPSSPPETQPLPFPEAPTTLLDTSALRSRAQLGKKRAPRSRPTRAARQSASPVELPEGQAGAADDWRYRDSTEEKVESKQESEDSEEQAKGGDPYSAASSQPQRIPIFPGMDPSALKAQLKRRGDSDSQVDGLAPSPSQLSRSPKSPFLLRAARVLPPSAGKENGEEDSPQWLKELKSKKRLSQYENDS